MLVIWGCVAWVRGDCWFGFSGGSHCKLVLNSILMCLGDPSLLLCCCKFFVCHVPWRFYCLCSYDNLSSSMQISYTQFLAAEFTVVVFTNKTHRLIVLLFDDLIILKKKKLCFKDCMGSPVFSPLLYWYSLYCAMMVLCFLLSCVWCRFMLLVNLNFWSISAIHWLCCLLLLVAT